ncbi:MAG: L-histidine N(alpha)-methyltransferase [Myxococcota bacterium]
MAQQWIIPESAQPQLEFAEAVRQGLSADPKTLPSQFFYDAEGSRLFEQICDLPEYYLTRAEAEILETHADKIAAAHPEIKTLVELGSGSAIKTEFLLRAFEKDGRALRYVPIDVSRASLEESIERLTERHPNLEICPVLADYERGMAELPALDLGPKLILWLGSSIGNLRRPAAQSFVSNCREAMSASDQLLIGIDLRKDRETLERAYDDQQGITAQFDMNLLARINRELGGRFDLGQFAHRAYYDEVSGSVESGLVSQADQEVRVDELEAVFKFAKGERIHTEDSFKYSLEEIDALAEAAGLAVDSRYFDPADRFSVNLMRPTR